MSRKDRVVTCFTLYFLAKLALRVQCHVSCCPHIEPCAATSQASSQAQLLSPALSQLLNCNICRKESCRLSRTKSCLYSAACTLAVDAATYTLALGLNAGCYPPFRPFQVGVPRYDVLTLPTSHLRHCATMMLLQTGEYSTPILSRLLTVRAKRPQQKISSRIVSSPSQSPVSSSQRPSSDTLPSEIMPNTNPPPLAGATPSSILSRLG